MDDGDDDDFLIELLTYTDPYTGHKRCAAQASLQAESYPEKLLN